MTRERRLLVALCVNVVLVAAQVIFGVVARSLGLLADAGHNLADVAAVGVSLVAVRWTMRRPTAKRSFGYHRGTILAAQANAIGLLIMTVLICLEGGRRLLHPVDVHGGVVAIVAGVAVALNLVAAWVLHDHGGDLNLRSALLHMLGDALASAGVVVVGVVTAIAHGASWLDPLVSIVIGLFIGYQAVRLLKQTTDVLLESTPAGLDVDALVIAIESVHGVESVHDLHVWSLSSDLRALSAHVVVTGYPTLDGAHLVAAQVKATVRNGFHIGHATLELESAACADAALDPCVGMNGSGPASHHSHRH